MKRRVSSFGYSYFRGFGVFGSFVYIVGWYSFLGSRSFRVFVKFGCRFVGRRGLDSCDFRKIMVYTVFFCILVSYLVVCCKLR